MSAPSASVPPASCQTPNPAVLQGGTGNFENFVDTTSVMEVDEPVREGAVWSGWQAPTAELSEALLARLLAQPDVEGAVSLAVTSRHWADTVADAEPCWSEAVRQR